MCIFYLANNIQNKRCHSIDITRYCTCLLCRKRGLHEEKEDELDESEDTKSINSCEEIEVHTTYSIICSTVRLSCIYRKRTTWFTLHCCVHVFVSFLYSDFDFVFGVITIY